MGLSAACSMGFFSCAYRPGATNATSDFERFRESATKYPELVEKLPSNFYISVLSLGFGKITSIYDTFFINSILSILQFIIMFLYWYFLSCIVVWIYDKFKKKQHSE